MKNLLSISLISLCLLLVGCASDGAKVNYDNVIGTGKTIASAQKSIKSAQATVKDIYNTGAQPKDTRVLKLETDLSDSQNNLKFALDDNSKTKEQFTCANKTIDSLNKKNSSLEKSVKNYKIITILALYLGALVFYGVYVLISIPETTYQFLKVIPKFVYGFAAVTLVAIIYFVLISIIGLFAWL